MLAISPADAVYKGTEATFYCCVNVDPRDFIPEEGVYFVQNGTRRREASTTPYQLFTKTDDSLFTVATCWALTIGNVQLSDSGSYSCITQPLDPTVKALNETLNFTVKTPRMIQNFTIVPMAHGANLSWDTQEGPMLKIGLKLYKRQGGKHEVWSSENAKSPQQLTGLEPATPYSLFIQVQDGHAATFQLTEHFQTEEGIPGPPEKEEIRLIDTTTGLQCEVEWRPPLVTNGQVVKYFVQLEGKLRYQPQDLAEGNVPIDYPPALEPCKNYDGTSDDDGIDAKKNFFACKFGPLKPNRNYAATIWSQNSAGKSAPVSYTDKCFMDFSAPDEIEPPEMLVTHNVSSFSLKFNSPPKEYNGPIACYYLAVVPLPSNVSIQSLPKPDNVIMESFEEAMRNNIQVASGQAYYAYIAESYLTYPSSTVIGDNKAPPKIEQCNVYYLSKSRFKAHDPPLQPDLKYTGFLIVRVDRDKDLHTPQQLAFTRMFQNRRSKRGKTERKNRANKYRRPDGSSKFDIESKETLSFQRHSRQLISIDPHYGYSSYFKPVFLQQSQAGATGFQIFLCILLGLFTLLAAAGSLLYLLYRKGFIHHFCPIKKEHNLLKQAFQAIPSDDLASEFIMRHRDSDYLFSAEFEALPKYKDMKFTASEKKENIKKNRYGDIKACDDTRVKLKVSPDGSDYINANFIKGYNGKRTFIATQAPLTNTVEDFWQMIWEHDVRVVIMVANMKERGRQQVDKYWPEEGEQSIFVNKDLEISCVDNLPYADYSKRGFNLVYTSYSSTPSSNGNNRTSSILQRTGSFRQHEPIAAVVHQEEESEYANISVLRPSSKNSNNRTNLLDVEVNREVRKIVHYHFTNWTDLKAPESTCGIMRLMLKLRKMEEYNNHPVLIHCSAGVGRTGTFIAIDSLIDQCNAEGKVDVFGTVSSIRQQRNGTMVQSQEQYVFIYRALVENLIFGDTDIPEKSFCDHLNHLKHAQRERRPSGNSQVRTYNVSYDLNGGSSSGGNSSPPLTISNVTQAAPTLTATSSVGAALNAKLKQWKNGLPNHNHKEISSSKSTGIEAEYEKLFTCLDNIRTINISQKEENISKNRFSSIVPYDRYCIMLAPRIGCSGSQYINATPHHGYYQDYFLAQDPVDSATCHDFWRLIDDNHARIIVMLSREDEFSPREKYWPEQQGVPFYFGNDEDLTVILTSEKVHPTFVERRISYKFKRADETIDIVQYAFTGWVSGAPVPPSAGPLRSLIRRIHEAQPPIIAQSCPIVVHSRDGSFEPGLFVCISTLLERLETEHMIDVFRTARAILQHRVGVFPKLEQYTFIYETIAEYIRSKQP
jgi:protein tyrosine phosphatase